MVRIHYQPYDIAGIKKVLIIINLAIHGLHSHLTLSACDIIRKSLLMETASSFVLHSFCICGGDYMPRVRRCRYQGCHAFAVLPDHYCTKHIAHEAEYQAQREKYRQRHTTRATTWHYNHVTRYRNSTKSEQNKFYHSREWQSLRTLVLQRDFSLCKYCRINPGNIVDHIVPIEWNPNKMRDINNLVTCCRDCHAKKTRWEQRYYGTGLHNTLKDVPAITDIKLINKLMNARERK